MTPQPPATAAAPAPGPRRAAPPLVRVRAQADFDARTTLRNGEQLLVTIVLPALALVGLTLAPVPEIVGHPRVDVIVPGVLALAILSSAFTGQAIGTAFDRRYGVLRLLGTTPLGRDGFLVGRILAVLVIQVLQFVVLGVVAAALGWRPGLGALPAFVLFWLVGAAVFVALALLFAGTLRAEAVLALANLAWALMAGAGGTLIATDAYPQPWRTIVAALPPGALGDGMRAAFLDHAVAWGSLGVLVAWGVVFALATIRTFRWSD